MRCLRAAGDQLSADGLEVNNSVATAHVISPNVFNNLTIDHSGTSGWDYYRFTASDYAILDIGLDYMPGLDNLNFVLTKEGWGGGSPESVTNTFRPNGRSYHVRVVSPGTYRLLLSNANPSLYNLHLSLNNIGLLPDIFEVNNTLATAANPANGNSNEVNLHQNSDVDFYHFNVSNLLTFITFKFNIDDSDNPVTARLFDATNSEVASSATSLTIPNGSYTLKVEGTKGRYGFSTGFYVPPPPKFVPIRDKFKWIDPGDPPIDNWLFGPDEFFSFGKNTRTNVVRLSSQGLHVSLLDENGKGQFDGQQQFGELLSLAGTQDGTNLVLRVQRVITDENPDQQPPTLPAVSYQLGTYAE